MKHRTGFAALGAALVLAGAAWGGSLAPATQAQVTPPPINRSLADGRTSYSDIVKAVAPSVVTVRVEGVGDLTNPVENE